MAFAPIPFTVKVEFIQSIGGTTYENVHYYQSDVIYDLTAMTALAADLAAFWITNWKTQFPTSQALQRIKITSLASQTAPVVEYAVGMPISGTQGTAYLPMNCALVVTKRTEKRGRNYRGRTYIAPLLSTNVAADVCNAVWVAGVTSKFELMKTRTVGDNVWTMAVVSYIHNGIPRTEPEVTLVTNYTSDGVVDSQRRRLQGRGA